MNAEIDEVHRLEDQQHDLTSFMNDNLKRHTELTNTMSRDLEFLDNKITVSMNIELLVMEFHKNVQSVRNLIQIMTDTTDEFSQISMKIARLLVKV